MAVWGAGAMAWAPGAMAWAAGAMVWAAGAMACAAVLRWAVRRGVLDRLAPRVCIEGTSMVPNLQPGDRLLVAPQWAAPCRDGDVVALHDPRGQAGILVKRVVAVAQPGIWVEGDNREHSTDSRDFGPVDPRRIIGRVVYRYAPLSQSGPIPRQR